MKFVLLSTLASVAMGATFQSQTRMDMQANPIRRVVTLLQKMQTEVTQEGEREQKLYKKFMCFCNSNNDGMTKEIEEAKTKIVQLMSQIEEQKGEKTRTDQELREHEADRAEAKSAIAKATAIRKREEAAYNAESSDTKSNIEALDRAIPALEKGMASFMQAGMARSLSVLRKLALTSKSIDAYERSSLTAFVESSARPQHEKMKTEGNYAPSSGQIVGILKQMKDEMTENLGTMVAEEKAAAKSFADLKAAKTAEIRAASESIEAKTRRSGELAVAVAESKADVKDTKASLGDSESFLADLSISCDTKTKEWDVRQHTRANELQAISEAIAILNDDDALDLFKKTIPSPAGGAAKVTGFLQKAVVSPKELQSRAKAFVSKVASSSKVQDHEHQQSLQLISFMLSSKKVDFSKVIALIENMIAHLATEQQDDDKHVEYCHTEFRATEGKMLDSKAGIEAMKLAIQEATEASAQLAEEIETLQKEIVQLDAAVEAATKQRAAEHEEFVKTQADLSSAQQLIEKAKNRLHKFYNPALHKEAPKPKLTEAERIEQNLSFVQLRKDEEPTTAEGEADAEPAAKEKDAKKEAPETWETGYKSHGQHNAGVIALLDMLKKQLGDDLAEGAHEEETAQKQFQNLVANSTKSKATNIQGVTNKEAAKAELDTRVHESSADLSASQQELSALQEFTKNLHVSCDFIVENFDFRKSARATERDALVNAKAALHGAKEE